MMALPIGALLQLAWQFVSEGRRSIIDRGLSSLLLQ